MGMAVAGRGAMTMESHNLTAVLNELRRSPLDYRHALGVLDSSYEEWRPEGKPVHEVVFFGEAPLMVLKEQGAYQVLWEPSGAGAQALVHYLEGREVNVLSVLGEPCYRALKPLLGEGRWTVSRNYGVTASQFQARPGSRMSFWTARAATTGTGGHRVRYRPVADVAIATLSSAPPRSTWGSAAEGYRSTRHTTGCAAAPPVSRAS